MKISSRHLVLGPLTLATAFALPLLTGCSLTPTASPIATPQTLALSGTVHGGQQPIVGAKVYLYSVAPTNGGASTSMLNGVGYVTSDANGNYSITSDYTCPAGNTAISTYLLALGGNPGLSTADATASSGNSAISLMAALGPCSGLSSSTFVVVNEVTTAAAVTALQQFMVDPTHIGSLAISNQPTYSAPQGIPNAMATANNLVHLAGGSALAAPVTTPGISPQQKLNTLGNILSACINSTSSTSAACTSLFNASSPTGTATVSDVASAMLQIAQNPGHSVAALFSQGGSVVPFAPALTTAPNDFSLAITFTSGLNNPGPLAVDNAGDVFAINCPTCNAASGSDSIVGFEPSGAFKTSGAAFTTNVHSPTAIAVDRYNALWVTEAASGSLGNQVTRLAYDTGAVQSGFPVALSGVPAGMALVENNPSAAWITDTTNGRINLINHDGTLIGGLNTSGLPHPTAIAADGLENLFMIGTGSTSVLEYSPIDPAGSSTPNTAGNFTTLPEAAAAGFSSPSSLAVDGGDHLWTVDTGSTKAVSELFAYTDTANSGTGGYPGINIANTVSIDGAGTAWVANCRASCTGSGSTAADNVVHLSADGANLNLSDGLQNSSLAHPTATAIDLSGNLWISNTSGASLTELVGVAVPVVTELETASSRHALPAVNYLKNPSFELGATGPTIPDWTTTSTGTGTANVDTSSPFAGQQKLTFYNGSPYTTTVSQTVTGLPSGNYLVSCYIASAPGSTTRTTSIIVSAYNGTTSTISVSPTNLTYTFQPYSTPIVPVANGTLTVGLYNNETYSGGGYVGWDSCSVTRQ